MLSLDKRGLALLYTELHESPHLKFVQIISTVDPVLQSLSYSGTSLSSGIVVYGAWPCPRDSEKQEFLGRLEMHMHT